MTNELTPDPSLSPPAEVDPTAPEAATDPADTDADGGALSAGQLPTDVPVVDEPAAEVEPSADAPVSAPDAEIVPGQEEAPVDEPAVASSAPAAGTPARSMAAPVARSLSYAVDIVFCIDVTGSMNPVLDAVKANALRFYDDVQTNLTDKGKHVDQLRVRVVAFRDFSVNAENALIESAFFALPGEQTFFDQFVNGLVAEGGGDAPESGLEAVALAITSPWTSLGDRRRQVVVVWTDQPTHPLDPSVLPPDLAGSVPADFDALTDLWEDAQGLLGPSSKRLILFAPDGPGWSEISANWENVVHHPSQAGGGLSEVDYSTIIDSIGNSV